MTTVLPRPLVCQVLRFLDFRDHFAFGGCSKHAQSASRAASSFPPSLVLCSWEHRNFPLWLQRVAACGIRPVSLCLDAAFSFGPWRPDLNQAHHDAVEALFAAPCLALVASLELRRVDTRALVRLPSKTPLTRLDIQSCDLDHCALDTLRRFDLQHVSLQLDPLERWPRLSTLSTNDIVGCLARNRSLRFLSLAGETKAEPLSDANAAILAALPELHTLHVHELSGSHLDGLTVVQTLRTGSLGADSTSSARLPLTDLRVARVDAHGHWASQSADAIAQVLRRSALQQLHLAGEPDLSACLPLLVGMPLRGLWLTGCVSDDDCALWTNLPLRDLHMDDVRLTDACFGHLAPLACLTSLSVCNASPTSTIHGAGFALIGHLPLEKLTLRSERLRWSWLEAAVHKWHRLTTLTLNGCNPNGAGTRLLNVLEEARPTLQISVCDDEPITPDDEEAYQAMLHPSESDWN